MLINVKAIYPKCPVVMFTGTGNETIAAWPDGAGGALTVEVRKHFDESELRIAEEGVGYALGAVKNGLGARLTRSLAKEASVLFDVASAPNSGTCITIRIQE